MSVWFLSGNISWTQLTKPAIFGNDVSLRCHLTSEYSCCDSFARKWSAGKTFDLIMMNGVSSNATKYTETVDNRFNTTTLTIKNFNENDVNIPYECTYGFDTFSKTLELTQANFECKLDIFFNLVLIVVLQTLKKYICCTPGLFNDIGGLSFRPYQ